MNEHRVKQEELFAHLPAEWGEDLLPAIQHKLRAAGRKVVVLDDDPTGTQTVHGLPVLTEWTVDGLADELRGSAPAFYLLTNSRSLAGADAEQLSESIGARLRQAQEKAAGNPAAGNFAESKIAYINQIGGSTSAANLIDTVSRSDSTLRGHFPGEVAALARGLGETFDAWLVAPCFPEGGRYTVEDVHYVAEGEWLVPAGQTEFARDKSFGYRSSNLRDWVAEKTGGAVAADQVDTISLADLRQGGPAAVTEKLLRLPRGAVCVANAVTYRDLEVLVLGLLEAEAQGKRYLYRTAASFVRVRAGIAPRALLNRAELNLPAAGGGLVVAGSYVPRTSAQLEALFQQTKVRAVEVQVQRLLGAAARSSEIERAREIKRARQAVNRYLAAGEDVALFTSRELVHAQGPAAHTLEEANLAIGRAVSDGLVEIVRGLEVRPRYLLAKGGITSSDIATRGLGIRRALVLGQILPGVPVWQSGPESRFAGLAYIVFPGNVGGPDALVKIVDGLAR